MAAGGPDARGYPAPGSAVPGAPPALRRALTPADGVLIAGGAAPSDDNQSVEQQVSSAVAPHRGGRPLRAAAAMFGVAAGLEIAGILARRRQCQMLT
ncbi:hypothetical protein CIW51_16120 [Mycolicibacterium sp. P9-22]|nr:hypothetical protein CIW51_16120 [Mycolicibacterium sp. P9-22]